MTMKSKEVLRSRLNDELLIADQHVCRSRGFYNRMELGQYYLFDLREGKVMERDIDLEKVAKALQRVA